MPGDALSLVVIDKLPFAPPTDPLVGGAHPALRRGRRRSVRAFQLPRAALALKQGFGRLIRRRDDRGIVAMLDGRLLHEALRPRVPRDAARRLPRTESLEDVTHFWEHGPVASADRVRAALAAQAASSPPTP